MSAGAVGHEESPATAGDAPVNEASSKPVEPAWEPGSKPASPVPISAPAPVPPVPTNHDAPTLAPVRTGPVGGTQALSKPAPWVDAPIPTGFSISEAGVTVSATGSRLSGPLWIAAATLDRAAGDHGLVIRWMDVQGQPGEVAVTRDELHGYASALPARLARAGLHIAPGEERHVLRYLAAVEPKELPLWNAVSRVGWIEEYDDGLAYMLPPPTGLIAAGSSGKVVFQPERESPSRASMTSRGTLDDWNREIVALCANNPLLLFPLLASLAAPLLRFAELEGGGFHLYGRSSHGKTTAAQVAASVWGNGADPAEAPDRAFVQKWNATANAFEALLSAHNDGLLVLDEIHTCDAKDFGNVLYNMAGGMGKQALDRERQLRKSRRWRSLFLSTGEISALQKLLEGGKAPHAGQQLRLLDIPIEAGIIVETGPFSSAAFADRLKRACSRFYGTAGPALVRELVREYADASQLAGTVRALLDHHTNRLTPPDAPPEHRRALKRFALLAIAGELTIKLGVLECTQAQVEAAVDAAVRAWRSDGANLPDRLRGVLNVQAFVERSEARFEKLLGDSSVVPQNRAGFKGYHSPSGKFCYLFTRDGFKEACGGQDPHQTALELKRLGLLIARESGHLTEKFSVDVRRTRLYVVPARILEFGSPPVFSGDQKWKAVMRPSPASVSE